MPGFPVLHHLPQFAQIHVHWVADAIQPSHPLSSSSHPALNLSKDQFFFFKHNGIHLMVFMINYYNFYLINFLLLF